MNQLSDQNKETLRGWSASQAQGEYRIRCPECADDRKGANKQLKTLNVRVEHDRVVYHCFHCNVQGAVRTSREPYRKSEYRAPKPRPKAKPLPPPPSELSDFHIHWLESRHISVETASLYGVHSQGDALTFPYRYTQDQTVGLKHRRVQGQFTEGEQKQMWASGAFPVPFGWDLLDPEIGHMHLFEGEIDALTGASIGLGNCVSIPTGASLGQEPPPWLLEVFDWAREHACIIRACFDADHAGEGAAQSFSEMAEKADVRYAMVPSYAGAKDLNLAVSQGKTKDVLDIIKGVQEPPIKGITKASEVIGQILDIYHGNVGQKHSTGWPAVDDLYQVPLGYMTVLTGYPNMGKSSWLDALLVNLVDLHGFSCVIWSPENGAQMHPARLMEIKSGLPFFEPNSNRFLYPPPRMRAEDIEGHLPWIDKHFTWLEDGEDPPTIESILSRMGKVVDRTGAQICVLDPYNNVAKPQAVEQETEWIRRLTVRCRSFARKRNVHFFLVAHPKQQPQAVKDHVPRGESISGGANWRAVADFGLTIHRPILDDEDFPSNVTQLHVWKVRHKHHGKLGMVRLSFDASNSRYRDHR